MGSFSLNGVFTAAPDPDYQPFGTPEVGKFLNGKPIRQGWESGVLKFPPMPTAAANELRARWLANRNAQTSGNIPALSGYGFVAVSAWWHEPVPTGWDGPIAHGISMVVSKVGYY